MKTLENYHSQAITIGAKTKLKNARTETGIKDTFQEFFFEQLFASYKLKDSPKAKQDALNVMCAQLSVDITSPVW